MTWQNAVEARVREVSARAEWTKSGFAPIPTRVLAGSVSYDGSAAENWASQGVRVEGGLLPEGTPMDLRNGWLLRIFWLISAAGESHERPLGAWLPTKAKEHTASVSDLTLRDPLWLVRQGGYLSSISVAGLSTGEACKRILSEADLEARGGWWSENGGPSLPTPYELGGVSPYEDLKTICDAAGWDISTDEEGLIRCGPVRPGRMVGVLDGGRGTHLIGHDREIDWEGMSTRVEVRSTAPGLPEPVAALAQTDGPPIWTRVETEAVATHQDAQGMANRLLGAAHTPWEAIQVEIPARPDLRRGDIIQLQLPRHNIFGFFSVRSWQMPIGGGAMKINLQGQRL
jgi:hypothetical protein